MSVRLDPNNSFTAYSSIIRSVPNAIREQMRAITPIKSCAFIAASGILALLALKIFYYLRYSQNSSSLEQKKVEPIGLETKEVAPVSISLNQIGQLDSHKDAKVLVIQVSKLDFSKREIAKDIFKEIAATCPDLESLSLYANDEGGFPIHLKTGFDSIADLTKLKTLKITNFSADKLSIGNHPSLQTLSVEDCIFSQFPEEIVSLTNLCCLTLVGNLFENQDGEVLVEKYSAILEGVKKNLMQLRLQDFRLTALPAALTESSIKEFARLRHLDLRNNPFDIKLDLDSDPLFPLLLDERNTPTSPKVSEGQNILMIGKTRTGKSTLLEVLTDQLTNDGIGSIFSETRESYLKTVTFRDITIDGKVAKINIHDSPGLFEVRKRGENSRNNKEILELICKDGMKFFGQKNLKNINSVVLTFSYTAGINWQGIHSLWIVLPFLQRMGLSKDVKILFIITHAENFAERDRESIREELNQYPDVGNFIKKYKVEVLFSGSVKKTQFQEVMNNQLTTVKKYRKDLIAALFGYNNGCRSGTHQKMVVEDENF